MMTLQRILTSFSSATHWNAFSYIFYKVLSTIISFALFARFTVHDFAAWSMINSAIFLILLWLDFGLRKSIPRFCPQFSRNASHHTRFIHTIVIFQSLILLAACLACYTLGHFFSHYFVPYSTYIYVACCLLALEGCIALLRLLFHAHFWNKQFTAITCTFLTVEAFIILFLLASRLTSSELLTATLWIKAFNLVGMIIVLGIVGFKLYKTITYEQDKAYEYKDLQKLFARHSFFMWMSNNIKSLSERNFLVPFLTATIGPAYANLFKVANDGALLFHRAVMKTIGTNDTALLTHMEIEKDNKVLLPLAFQKLMSQVAALCIPLLGIALLVGIKKDYFLHDPMVFKLFFIATCGYLIEALLSPYERILEVKTYYRDLFICYVPYIVFLIALYTTHLITLIGIVSFIALVQGVRLVSACLMVYYARRRCDVYYPHYYVRESYGHRVLVSLVFVVFIVFSLFLVFHII